VRGNDLATALPLLDPATFTFLEDCHAAAVGQWRIAEDKNFSYVFRDDRDCWIVGQKPASALAYRPLGCGYSLIDGSVYFGIEPIAGADPRTFEALITFRDPVGCYRGWYARDSLHVYYRGKPVDGADAGSFVAFCHPRFSDGVNMFAFDAGHRYLAGEPIPPERADIWRHLQGGIDDWRAGTVGRCSDR